MQKNSSSIDFPTIKLNTIQQQELLNLLLQKPNEQNHPNPIKLDSLPSHTRTDNIQQIKLSEQDKKSLEKELANWLRESITAKELTRNL